MVLMIVVKYLAGQFFFLTCKSRAVNTFAHRERYEVKRLRLGSASKDYLIRYTRASGPRTILGTLNAHLSRDSNSGTAWRPRGFTPSPFSCRNLDRAPIQIVMRFDRRSYAQIERATLLYILYNTQCNPHAQRTPLCRGTPSCPIGPSRSRSRSRRLKNQVRKRALMPAQKKQVVWRQSEKNEPSLSISPLR